jgi:RNA polymerase sigma-B factor
MIVEPAVQLDGGRAVSARLLRYSITRDPTLRDAIIESHLPLARRTARRFGGGKESAEDLFQVACVGLIKAVDRFDPARGTAFSSFAIPTMTGELRRHLRDHGWALRVPRGLQELSLTVRRTREELRSSTGREPTVRQLARALNIGDASVVEALRASSARYAESLDEPVPQRADAAADAPMERVETEEAGYARVENRVLLEELTRHLSRHEREILRLRLAEDLTQRDIAARLGLSQMTISRVLRSVCDELARIAGAPSDGVSAGRQLQRPADVAGNP